ncbi:hypothetical protein L218DRAFT_1056687 [Marasmius fiardii PR-910]|nr:hypothetical protein L218DRAFT_1056687 [Marasmius fiardii PR-910]
MTSLRISKRKSNLAFQTEEAPPSPPLEDPEMLGTPVPGSVGYNEFWGGGGEKNGEENEGENGWKNKVEHQKCKDERVWNNSNPLETGALGASKGVSRTGMGVLVKYIRKSGIMRHEALTNQILGLNLVQRMSGRWNCIRSTKEFPWEIATFCHLFVRELDCFNRENCRKTTRVFSIARISNTLLECPVFKGDCLTFSRIKDPNVMQLHAFNDSQNPLLLFHDLGCLGWDNYLWAQRTTCNWIAAPKGWRYHYIESEDWNSILFWFGLDNAHYKELSFCWLAQAFHIFQKLNIPWDELYIFDLYYWSPDPEGHLQLTEEECAALGLPCPQPNIAIYMITWSLKEHNFVQDFQKARDKGVIGGMNIEVDLSHSQAEGKALDDGMDTLGAWDYRVFMTVSPQRRPEQRKIERGQDFSAERITKTMNT